MNTLKRVPYDVEGLVEHTKASDSEIYIFGADIAGKIVNRILKSFDVNVRGFVDNNKNKTHNPIDTVPVLHAPNFLSDVSKDAIVLIASTYISDIIRQIEDRGFYNWAPISNFLSYYSPDHYRSILSGELRKNHAGGEFTRDFDAFVLENMKNSQVKYLDPNKLYIRSVDIMITERCSLKCKDCSNLMQYYEKPQNIDTASVMNEIDLVTEVADEINELRIIGGDAFVNKDFPAIVNYAAEKNNVNKVVIYTNGTIAPDEEKIKLMSKSKKIFVFVTTYGPLSRNAEKLAASLSEHEIQFNQQPAYGWTDCGTIERFTRTPEQQQVIFKNCCAKHFTTLTDGKLFRCPFAANLHRLEAAPEYSGDYVDLAVSDKNTLKRRMWEYLREIPYISYCDHCKGRTYGDPEIEPGVQTKQPLFYAKVARVEKATI
jgi:hypothetical protein